VEDNTTNWERIYGEGKPGSFLEYPNENLVRLFHRIRPQLAHDIRCLDYGFGSGNNSEFLITKVSELYGIEVSEASLRITSERLSRHDRFNPGLFLLANHIDHARLSGMFDLLVAWQVLYYNTEEQLLKAIHLLADYMADGGVIIATLATPRDISARCSVPLGGNEYKISAAIPDQEGCVVTIPESERSLHSYFDCFEMIDSGYFETFSFSDSTRGSSHYYFLGRKRG